MNAFGPAQALKVITALLVIPKTFYEFAEVDCFYHEVTMPKKMKKHPSQMTDEEALKHLFHPKIVKAVKSHLKQQLSPTSKRGKK